MYIKSYETQRFAGLKDLNINFDKGINVILGPNESGKSTVIHGIYSTLFKDIKLKMNNNKDKSFKFSFMPISGGDFIDGKIILKTEDGEYELSKEWGSNENISFKTPDNKILKDEKSIYKELSKVLNFGESTYNNIVFAKQRDLKRAIDNIIENKEATSEISDSLRKTLMELDGVSIDKIEENLINELNFLYKKWDIEKNYPENNRGINNKYKSGLGEIIKKYYEKEDLKVKMEESYRVEKNFEEICSNISKVQGEKDKLEKEKNSLESIEEDINNRDLIETKIDSLKKEGEVLTEVSIKWPKTTSNLEFYTRDLKKVEENLEKLNLEKKQLDSINRKKYLEEKINKINKLKEEKLELEKEISKLSNITKEDLDKIQKLNKEILTLETAIKAGKIVGKIIKSSNNKILIKKGFSEEENISSGESFEAKGIVNINYNNELEIEIKTGELDFEELLKKYKDFSKQYEELLKDLKVKNIEEATENFELLNNKNMEMNSLKDKINILLGEENLEDLVKELEGLKDIDTSVNISNIDIDLEKLNNEKIEILSNKISAEKDIKNWTEKYENETSLFNNLVDIKFKNNQEEEKLKNLSPLPERFKNVEEFKNRLLNLKSGLSRGQLILDNLNKNYYESKEELLDETYEEIKKAYLESEKDFKKLLNRGKKLLEIEKIFYATKEEMDNNPMKPLIEEFKKYLKLITKNSFVNSNIDDNFNIDLKKEEGSIPLELLSAGTYDAVTLAFRFSILNYIFEKNSGFIILDDCLVDLDPKRREESINLIKEFSKLNQIIFTTCDPDTAKMLGGNLIEL